MPPSLVRVLLLGIVAPAVLSACSTGPYFVAKNEPWRAAEEESVPRLRRHPPDRLCAHTRRARRSERVRGGAALRDGRCRRRPGADQARSALALPDDPAGRPLGYECHRAGRAQDLRRPPRRGHDHRLLCLPADEQRLRRPSFPSTGTPMRSMSRASSWRTARASRSRPAGAGAGASAPSCTRSMTAPAPSSRRC